MVSNVTPQSVKFMTDQGAKAAATPAEIAAQVGWLFLCVPDTGVVEANVLSGNIVLAGAIEGLVVVDLSTSSHMVTLEIAK